MMNKRLAIGTYIIRFVVKILQLLIIYDLQVSLSSDIFILCSMIIHRIGMVTLNFGTVQWNPIDIEMHLCVSEIKTCNFFFSNLLLSLFFSTIKINYSIEGYSRIEEDHSF